MIRLLVVDDQPAVRKGLRMRLAAEPDLAVVGEAGDGEAALTMAQALHPDIVLMDLAMPRMDGVAATELLRDISRQTRVICLSIYDDEATQDRATAAGAAAFVSKRVQSEALIAAIRNVARGEAVASS